MKKIASFALIPLIAAALSSCASTDAPAPYLEKRGEVTQLIVEGQPWLALGCELKNSSSTSAEYMAPIWKKLQGKGLNTVIGSVSWEQIEPVEGEFDFKAVDDMINGARGAGMKLVLIWFASWKNGLTSYVPGWVQKDTARFPLAMTSTGGRLPVLSTLGEESCAADSKAFAALMRHIREVDAAQQTVIMMQVENEVGLHGETRDHCPAAEEAFASAVPSALTAWLTSHELLPETSEPWTAAGNRTSGTWTEVFGEGDAADEFFMAWNYASYIDKVTAAGKAEYDIPMYANAWIVQPADEHPGDYPSGGPQAQCHDIWRAAAPHIDFLSPDIYLPDYPAVLDLYSRNGNPVFVPEATQGMIGAASAVYTFGNAGFGYSPFGLDSYLDRPSNQPLFDCYKALGSISDKILDAQAEGRIGAAWLKGSNPEVFESEFTLGDWKFLCSLVSSGGYSGGAPNLLVGSHNPQDCGYVLAIDEGDGNMLVMGANARVQFRTANGEGVANVCKVIEGYFEEGQWHPLRWLDGDEMQLRFDMLDCVEQGLSGAGLNFPGTTPGFVRIELYKY